MNRINVTTYLDDTAARLPDKLAFTDGAHGLTFRQLRGNARAIGTSLHSSGFYREPVLVFMKRGADMIAAFFGALYAGCAYVPVDAELGLNRIRGILENLNPRAAIVDESATSMLAELGYNGKILDYYTEKSDETDDTALDEISARVIDVDLMYVVYTSGSTGAPKGVAACHRSVIDYAESLSDALGFSEDTVFGNQTPLYVDACLKEVYPTIMFGATTFLIPREMFLSPITLPPFLRKHGVNTICWVVSALTMLSGLGVLDEDAPESLTTVAFGSESFPLVQLKRWRKALPNARFFNLYGPTECTGMSCWYEVTRDFEPGEPIPIGKPFRNTEILLLDGEICIRGTSLTLGYYNDFDKTDASFTQNPNVTAYRDTIYRTGDRGEYNERGELVFLGRGDAQVKHMGHRVELGEIESVAQTLDGVTRAVCLFDEKRKKLTLYAVTSRTSAEISEFCAKNLPRFMCPNAIVVLDAFPLTVNGKIDRVALARVRTRIEN